MSTPSGPPSVVPRVSLVPGAGIVIRSGAFLCVLGPDFGDLVADIATIEDTIAVPDATPRRGRHVVRALALLVGTADRPIDIAFAAPDTVGIALFLSGKVFAETDGRRLQPGTDTAFDRAIPWPVEGLGIYLAGTEPTEPGEEVFDLVGGTVPAAGALLHTPLGMRGTDIHPMTGYPAAPASGRIPRTPPPVIPVEKTPPPVPIDEATPSGAHAEAAAEPAAQPEPVTGPTPMGAVSTGPQTEPLPTDPDGPTSDLRPEPPDAPPPAPPAEPGFVSASLTDESDEPPRAPLPKDRHKRPATEVVELPESRALVHGIRCSRGHLNHPRAWLCAVCGIRMEQLTGVLVQGERPPLGWLLLDNGSTYLLDEDLVIGREPGSVGGRRTGSPKPIRVQDETGQLSRRHVEIRLVEWTVELIDLGSANGTFVTEPAAAAYPDAFGQPGPAHPDPFGHPGFGAHPNGPFGQPAAGAGREIRIVAGRPHVLVPGSHVRIGGRHFLFESPHARV